MIEHFPAEFILESGTKVIVDKKGPDAYNFSLQAPDAQGKNFTYVDDGRPKADWDEKLEFEQLEALRTFWLMNEEIL